MSRLLSCCALLLLLATPARAADPVPAADPALARQLDAMQIKYTVDEDGPPSPKSISMRPSGSTPMSHLKVPAPVTTAVT